MTGTRRWLAAVAVAGAVALLAGCADFSRGDPSPMADAAAPSDGGDASTSDVTTEVSFAANVYPLLVPTCQKCHSPGQAAGDTNLLFIRSAAADYATVVMFIDKSSPSGSRLLAKMSGSGHSGGTVYAAGSPAYQTVLRWIEQGAQP